MGQCITNWSPPGSWCLSALCSLFSDLLVVVDVDPLTADLSLSLLSQSSPALVRSPAPQHTTLTDTQHRAAHAGQVLSLRQNLITTSTSTLTVSHSRWMLSFDLCLFWNSQFLYFCFSELTNCVSILIWACAVWLQQWSKKKEAWLGLVSQTERGTNNVGGGGGHIGRAEWMSDLF